MLQVIRLNSDNSFQKLGSILKNKIVGVAIGNFDGIHLGHQQLFLNLSSSNHRKAADDNERLIKVILSFYPHPKKYFAKEKNQTESFQEIFSITEKIEVIKQFGFDYLVLLRFNKNIQQMSSVEFVEQILRDTLNSKIVCVGDDWRFGANQAGNVQTLEQYSSNSGYQVESVSSFLLNGRRISTGYVKEVLETGDLSLIQELLGYEYFVIGKVVRGDGRGKRLMIPTANLSVSKRKVIKSGVYATEVELKGKRYFAVTNVGSNPTFSGTQFRIESHLLDYRGPDFYQDKIKIIFKKRIRDVLKFTSVEQLLQQIQQDIQTAKEYFKIS